MSDVSHRALDLFFFALQQRGIPLDALTEGTELELAALRRERRIPWDDFARLAERFGELVGGETGLVEVGRTTMDVPGYARYGRALRAVATPTELYRVAAGLLGRWVFGVPTIDLIEGRHGGLEVRIRIGPSYRGSPAFFAIVEGVLASYPKALTGQFAQVERLESADREARYQVRVPPLPGGLFGRVQGRLRALGAALSPSSLLVEALGREDEWQVLTWELAEQRRDLESRVEELERVRDELTRTRERERRAAEERLELERQLLHAQKLESLGLLAGGIAHDFNNLLTGIRANVEMLLQDEAAWTENSHRRLRRVALASTRAAELTDRILAYSGRPPFVVRPVDLSGVVEEIGDLLVAALPKTVRLVRATGACLPAVEGDPAQLQQVAMNLITNAAEALEGREGTVRVATALRRVESPDDLDNVLAEPLRSGAYVVLEVSDDGPGIDPAVRARMFDPFYSTKGQGRGLGLSTVIGVVRGHAGALEVESAPGRGTTFRAWFPACAGRVPLVEGASGAAAAGRACNVLVIDDEEIVRQTAADLLDAYGFAVTQAGDGQEALEALAADPSAIDVVLLDWSMPGLSGADVFEALRVRWPEIPVVLCSAYDLHQELEALWPRGLAAFVRKPWMGPQLAEVLRSRARSVEGLPA